MEKKRNVKGVTLIALVVTIIVLIILTFTITINMEDYMAIQKQKNFETDIHRLEEAINVYCAKNKQLPILNKYTYLDTINSIKDANDGENYYVLDIDRLENNQINFGQEYREAQKRLITQEIADLKDIYIINEVSHVIYYPKGVEVYGEMKYTLGAENNKIVLPESNPYLPKDATIIESSTMDKGLTIKDKNSNEWVWVEVPKSITQSAKTEEEIYNVLEEYTKDYRKEGYTDTWYEGCGLSETQYNVNKTKMLNSIKTYGGFWIGRYELGTEIQRRNSTDTLSLPKVQADKYPYNNITCSQAQERCSILVTEKEITSSLLYGIQWNLTLKFMERKGTELGATVVERQTKLQTDSGSWGNYENSIFDITKGKYSIDYGQTFIQISGNYAKPRSSVLLTTGATIRNRSLNIYDLAGNEYEYTLEKSSDSSKPCSSRGGKFTVNSPASYYDNSSIINSDNGISARPTLFK